MTSIKLYTFGPLVAVATGHAGYAKDGEPDIVCAAVSTLFCTAANVLKTHEKLLKAEPMVRLEPGLSVLYADPLNQYGQHLNKLLCFLSIGCEALAIEYPDHIVFSRVEKPDPALVQSFTES